MGALVNIFVATNDMSASRKLRSIDDDGGGTLTIALMTYIGCFVPKNSDDPIGVPIYRSNPDLNRSSCLRSQGSSRCDVEQLREGQLLGKLLTGILGRS